MFVHSTIHITNYLPSLILLVLPISLPVLSTESLSCKMAVNQESRLDQAKTADDTSDIGLSTETTAINGLG